MALPKQIRNQIKQGETIEAEIRKQQEEGGVADDSQQKIDSFLEELDPDNKQEPTGDQPPKDNVTKLRPKPEEGGDPESLPEPLKERTDWKQKYSVLKGKYDAEVPRLSQDLRDANSRIQKLEDKISEIAVKPVQQEPEKPRADFTPEEIADYGEDLLEVIGRKARAIVNAEYLPKIDALNSEISTLKQSVGETGQRVAKQETNEVFAQLDREVENWRKTNVDPEFHEWLDQVDPFSGETRKNLMLNAFNRKNAQQVKAFFVKFAEENAAVVPNAAAPAPSEKGDSMHGATLNLENYVAPGSPRGGGDAGAPKDKRVWTSREIGAFYADVQKGRFKNRPDDKARIEADIVAATREGRVKS